jgi:hypothetical protein
MLEELARLEVLEVIAHFAPSFPIP